MTPVALITHATTAHVRVVAEAVRHACAGLGYRPRQADRVELAVVEALNNVAEHAYGGRPGLVDVELGELAPLSRCLTVTLRHGGTPPPARPPASGPGIRESGFGLLLVHEIAEAVWLARRGHEHVLTLLFTPA